jgi:hypothetical protein
MSDKGFWDSAGGQVTKAVVVVAGAAASLALLYGVYLGFVFVLSQLGIDPGIG